MYSHIAGSCPSIKRLPSDLHIISVVFNPLRFRSRYNLFKAFKHHVEASGATLWVVELAYGERPFEVAECDNRRHLKLRTTDELWHKERMINEAVTQLPLDWKYVAWVDADVTFVNPDWVHETMQQLQHHPIVQMFTHAIDIGENQQPIDYFEGFAHSYLTKDRNLPPLNGVKGKKGDYYTGRHWHPGYAWAYRRDAWDAIGGMLDINIVGGGDHQMAYGLIGKINQTIPGNSSRGYTAAVKQWAANAAALKRDIGAVPGTLVHHFHGKKVNRGYFNRWKILTDNQFNPVTDIKPDWQMMWKLSGNKIALRDQLRAYFRARNEDSI